MTLAVVVLWMVQGGVPLAGWLAFAVSGLFWGLLFSPDIDINTPVKYVARHRGFFHSIWWGALAGFLTFAIANQLKLGTTPAMFSAYGSFFGIFVHSFGDGVQAFFKVLF